MFKILFVGTFVPVQGTQHIIHAAKILEREDVTFFFAGDGQEREPAQMLATELGLRNVVFYGMLDSGRLVQEMASADVLLGNFGDTPLAPLIISNKVYEALAMQKPVITSDMPANRELFNDDDVVMIPVANPEALASAILKLKQDPILRERIAHNGHDTFMKNATPQVLGAELKSIIRKLL